jgi:hypothetical protein
MRSIQVRRLLPVLAATLAAALPVYGCDDSQHRWTPPPLIPTPIVSVAVLAPPPVLTSISPAVGSTEGGIDLRISGTGFDSTRVTLKIGGVLTYSGPVYTFSTPPYTTQFFTAALPGAAGQADVVLTNGDGQSSTLKNGFTYLPPSSFEFNGDWDGITGWRSELDVSFTIRNNTLVSASCGGSPDLVVIPIPVTNGSFSMTANGNSFSGRIVGHGIAAGIITGTSLCSGDTWSASRRK